MFSQDSGNYLRNSLQISRDAETDERENDTRIQVNENSGVHNKMDHRTEKDLTELKRDVGLDR